MKAKETIRQFVLQISVILTVTLISACSTTEKKPDLDIAEVNTLLKNITLDAIKNQDYKQAQRSINALILNDDSKDSGNWAFVHPALISLPKEMAYEVIDNAMKSSSVSHSSDKMFSLAKVYISFQDTDNAESTINKSIELNKNNYPAIYWRARLLTIKKDYESAQKDFEKVVKARPENEEYLEQYASFLQETSHFEDAQKVLSKLSDNPDNIFKRIVFALQNKNYELANSLYPVLKSIKVSEDSQNNKNFLLGEAAYWLEKDKESIEYYLKVEGGDKYLDSREMLSLLYYDNEKYDDAVEILHQLQNAEEKYAVKAYRLEAEILKKQGEIRDAIRLLSTSLSIVPDNSDLLYDRAMLYEESGKTKKAIKDFKSIIEKNPNHYQALNALGYTMADHDMDIEKANEYVTKAVELSPDSAAIIDSLGWIQYKMGEYDKAEETLKKAMSKELQDPEIYYHLYKVLLKQNKKQEADDIFNKGKELFKGNNNFQQESTDEDP